VVVHDFVRDTVRAALMKNRPVPQFAARDRGASYGQSGVDAGSAGAGFLAATQAGVAYADEPSGNGPSGFFLQAPVALPVSARLNFEGGIAVDANAAVPVAQIQIQQAPQNIPDNGCAPPIPEGIEDEPTLESLRTLRPLGQIRNSFHPCSQ